MNKRICQGKSQSDLQGGIGVNVNHRFRVNVKLFESDNLKVKWEIETQKI